MVLGDHGLPRSHAEPRPLYRSEEVRRGGLRSTLSAEERGTKRHPWTSGHELYMTMTPITLSMYIVQDPL